MLSFRQLNHFVFNCHELALRAASHQLRVHRTMTRRRQNQVLFPNPMAQQTPRRQVARRFVDQAGKQAMQMLRSSSTKVSGPSDPRPLSRDLIVTKTFEYTPVGTGNISITPAFISAAFPGGAAVFTRFRLVKISAWSEVNIGEPALELRIVDDESTFVDRGTPGALLAQLHISPTFNLRNTWQDSTDTTVLAVGNQGITTTSVVIYHITVEMRSLPDTP